ncbi:MAG: hypothetical protein ACI8W8_003864 [Rhodothermales bacterium]|jgi:hypothetical protein
MRVLLASICLVLLADRAQASGWYAETVPKGAEIYSVDLKWKQWPPATYFAFWNGGLYPKGGVYYGGLISGPAKDELDYHGGLIWSFWNHRDYQGKIARAIHTHPTMYAHQYGGEGMCGGIAGDRLPWMHKDRWYRMLLRVWRPVDEAEDHSYIGWWCKDLQTSEWRLLGVFELPCQATGLSGNVGFIEMLGETQERRFLDRRNGYHRLKGEWGHSNSMKVTADASHTWLAELTEDDRVASFMHSKNPQDRHNVEPGQSKTITVTQPLAPVLDAPGVRVIEALGVENQVLLRWKIPVDAAPQLGYHVTAFDRQGKKVGEAAANSPFARICRLDAKGRVTQLELTITDIFNQTRLATAKVSLAQPPPGVADCSAWAPGLEYRYYELDEDLTRLPDTAALKPVKSGIVNDLDIHLKRDRNIAIAFSGKLNIQRPGLYHFYLQSSDGSRLMIGGDAVIANDGKHSDSGRAGHALLGVGGHDFALSYFKDRHPRYRRLQLSWSGPGFSMQPVPPSAFTARPESPKVSVATKPTGNRLFLQANWEDLETKVARVDYYRDRLKLGSTTGLQIDEQLNVARFCPVEGSATYESGTTPVAVTDGQRSKGCFMNGSKNNWFLVDLGRIRELRSIFTQWHHGDGRFYSFDLEVSTDRETWKTVASRTDTAPETAAGHLQRFAPTKARYIRVANIANSVNQSLHLYELMAFEKNPAPPLFALSTLLPAGDNRIWTRVTDEQGNSYDSRFVTVSVADRVDSDFTVTTLGETGLPLGIEASDDSFAFMGEGRGFAYKTVRGDFTLTARVRDVTQSNRENGINRNSWIGLAISDDADERWPRVGLYRTAGMGLKGSADFSDLGGTRLTLHSLNPAHMWLRLMREGDVIYSYSSQDGETWEKTQETTTRALKDELAVGLLFRTIPYENASFFSGAVDSVQLLPQALPRERPASIYPETKAEGVLDLIRLEPGASTIYARRADGMLRSLDGGETWSDFGDFTGKTVHGFAGTDDTLLAVADSALFRSKDAGASWAKVRDYLRLPAHGLGQILSFNPHDAQMASLATMDGLFLSRDAGASWEQFGFEGQEVTAAAFNYKKAQDLVVTTYADDTARVYLIDVSKPARNWQPVTTLADCHISLIALFTRSTRKIHFCTSRGVFNTWTRGNSMVQRLFKGIGSTRVAAIGVDEKREHSAIATNSKDGLALHFGAEGVIWPHSLTAQTAYPDALVTGLLKVPGTKRELIFANKHGIFRCDAAGKVRQLK